MSRPKTGRCAWINCGNDFPIPARGKIAEYCSRTCQVAALRRRQAKQPPGLTFHLDPDLMTKLAATADRLVWSRELLASKLIEHGLAAIDDDTGVQS